MSEQVAIPCWKQRPVQNILIIALFAEIGYATLNLATMPTYLQDDRGFGASVSGLVMVTFLLFEAIFKTITGHLADRFGTRKLMIAGPSISIVTSIISIFLPHMNGAPVETLAFIVLRAFDGIAVAMLWPAAFAQMNSVVADDERQHAMSYLNACYMIGIALAFPLGGIVNDLSGHKFAGIILAAILFAGAAFASQRVAHATPPIRDEHSSGLQDFLDSMRQIPEYLLLATVTFMGVGFPLTNFKPFLEKEFNLSESAIGLMILPAALAMAGLSGTMARLGERLGKVRAVHLGLLLCATGVSIIALGAFLPFLRHVSIFALGGLPVGFGFMLTIPAWNASVSDINPERRATNIGAVMTAQGVGAMIGAAVGATCYEKLQPLGRQLHLGLAFGRYSPFVGCAACVILGFLLSLKILHEPKKVEALPQAADVVAEGVYVPLDDDDVLKPDEAIVVPPSEESVVVEEHPPLNEPKPALSPEEQAAFPKIEPTTATPENRDTLKQ